MGFYQHVCTGENKIVWLISVLLVSSVIVFQFIELPEENFLPSIFSHSEAPRLVNSTAVKRNSTVEPSVENNVNSPSIASPADGGFKNSTSSYSSSRKQNGRLNFTSGLDDNAGNPSPNDATWMLGSASFGMSRSPSNYVQRDGSLPSNSSNEGVSITEGEDGSSISFGPISLPTILPAPNPMPAYPNETHGSSTNSSPALSPTIIKKHNSSSRDSSLSNQNSPGSQQKQSSIKDIYTISDMNLLLRDSYSLSHAKVAPRSSKIHQDLLFARSQIENAPAEDRGLFAPLYHNVSMFQRSYELMEQVLKVYVYEEGQTPIFHSGPIRGIYASEGWFMKLMEGNRQFTTRNPKEAHLFYLPFSSCNLVKKLYVPNSHSHDNLIQHLKNYLDTIVVKHPFWNRTDGADHFLVACHDWAPVETQQHMSKCIRALCNADVKEGFSFGKDVSLPETIVVKVTNPLRSVGGKSPSERKILAFFAGKMHGSVRPILLRYWQNKDPDMKISGKLQRVRGNKNYIDYMKTSKYCLCPKGYDVNSPRVVEAIFYECVPVIISDNFVPPFSETLNWECFAVFVPEKDIPNLKNILMSIPEKTYLEMQIRVKKVQQHFLWHPEPVKYDLFHMILHSVWYNRVFQYKPG